MSKHRSYDPDFKAKVVLEVLKGQNSINSAEPASMLNYPLKGSIFLA